MKNLKNKFIVGDCINKLKLLKDNTFDHCITDPPYSISNYDNKKEIGWYKSNKIWKDKKNYLKINESWDSFTDDEYIKFSKLWIDEVCRVTKKNGNILIFGSYHNIYKIGYILEKLNLRIINSIIWYKRNAFPNITQRMFCESTEQIIWVVNNNKSKAKNWVFNYQAMKELTENKKQMRNMWDIPNTSVSEKKFGKHPSQKPIKVIERLILGCSNKNDLILDPFCGSGTTAVVSKMYGRNFYCIEKNKKYLHLARKRLDCIK
jgi:site-specific DNA-methyltransferase (adenine-specific)